MDKTHSYTYFFIESNGEIDSRGLVGYDNGIFDPDKITNLLGIKPFKSWRKGDLRKSGNPFLFSNWVAEKSHVGRLDIEAQCMETIKNLKYKVDTLKEIKEKYDVHMGIMIVPKIFGEEVPIMSFNKGIIEFCYLVGATIEVDMYVFSEEDD